MQVTGTLKAKFDSVQVSEKFTKRDFVITTDEMYPQDILIQLVQDKCKLIDPVQIGSKINVSINIRGKEHTNKTTGEVRYFNTLDAWKIEAVSGGLPPKVDPNNLGPVNSMPGGSSNDDDDLPF